MGFRSNESFRLITSLIVDRSYGRCLKSGTCLIVGMCSIFNTTNPVLRTESGRNAFCGFINTYLYALNFISMRFWKMLKRYYANTRPIWSSDGTTHNTIQHDRIWKQAIHAYNSFPNTIGSTLTRLAHIHHLFFLWQCPTRGIQCVRRRMF